MSDQATRDVPDEVVAEAKKMGWVEQEKFRGNADHWVDADEFVERGKTVLPILSATNKRLKEDLLTANSKIDTLGQQLSSATTAIDRLEKHWSEANKRAVETAKSNLKSELKDARENGDTDAEDRILGKLEEIRESEREAAKAPEQKVPAKKDTTDDPNPMTPAMKQWMKDNDWFGPDKKKTKEYNRLAEDLREEGETATDSEFFEILDREYAKRYGEQEEEEEEEPTPRRPSKAESGSHGQGNRSGKGFSSLPKEARDACHADIDELVGENKQFKTVKEWESYYYNIYVGS